jgi:hypothetical protein
MFDIYKKIKNTLAVICVAVILFISITKGISSGKLNAQTAVVTQNVEAVLEGLDFFYGDYEHYPNAFEFADIGIMSSYYNYFPPHNFVSEKCTESVIYNRVNANRFQIGFCLPKALAGFEQGWNNLEHGK